MFNSSFVIRKDMIHDIGIPMLPARAVVKSSALSMNGGLQNWPGPGQAGGQGPLRSPLGRACFSHPKSLALLSLVSASKSKSGWLSTWVYHGGEAPSHLF